MGFLSCTLLIFEALSSLRVNLSKSILIPIGDEPHILDLAEFFSCGLVYFPSSHLGLALGTPKCKAVWEPIVERFHKRLAG